MKIVAESSGVPRSGRSLIDKNKKEVYDDRVIGFFLPRIDFRWFAIIAAPT